MDWILEQRKDVIKKNKKQQKKLMKPQTKSISYLIVLYQR